MGLNLIVRAGPMASEAMQRTPGLMLDLMRLVLVLVASAFVASEIWSVDLGSLLAALGVGSVVIGLALQDTLSGLFSGVSLMSGRFFREGDWIEFGEASGKIVRMDWRSVTIETLDDERLMVIPNSQLAQGVFTVMSSATRVFGQNLYVKFGYGVPPARAMQTPSKFWTRVRSPSTTFTPTRSVSPGRNSGIWRFASCFSASSLNALNFV